jgi:hypothetical protein
MKKRVRPNAAFLLGAFPAKEKGVFCGKCLLLWLKTWSWAKDVARQTIFCADFYLKCEFWDEKTS